MDDSAQGPKVTVPRTGGGGESPASGGAAAPARLVGPAPVSSGTAVESGTPEEGTDPVVGDRWPAAGGGLRHVALFYRGQAEYETRLTEVVEAALAAGEPVFIAVPGTAGVRLRRALGRDAQQVVFTDITELGRNPARIIPAVAAFTDRHPGARVCYIGEPAWPGRTAAELTEAARHEALLNLAFAGRPVTVVCPYDRAGLPPGVLADAERTHPMLGWAAHGQASSRYQGPARVPAHCEQPLPAPPAEAECLDFGADLRGVRALVATHAALAGQAEARRPDLVLAVSEVAANTLRHTPGTGTLFVWHTAREIICQVEDRGWITDPLAGRRRPSADAASGQGLWLVNQVCDLVEIRSGEDGTVVRMRMSLHR